MCVLHHNHHPLNLNFMNDTLTLDNLLDIYNSMCKISNNDRSDYFNAYYSEIKERINCKLNEIAHYETM